jgi:hypothetical protein
MSSKGVLQRFPPRMSSNNVLQGCPPRMSSKDVCQGVLQICPPRVYPKGVLRGCPPRVSSKGVLPILYIFQKQYSLIMRVNKLYGILEILHLFKGIVSRDGLLTETIFV